MHQQLAILVPVLDEIVHTPPPELQHVMLSILLSKTICESSLDDNWVDDVVHKQIDLQVLMLILSAWYYPVRTPCSPSLLIVKPCLETNFKVSGFSFLLKCFSCFDYILEKNLFPTFSWGDIIFGGEGVVPDPIFWLNSFSKGQIRLPPKFQLPRQTHSRRKVRAWKKKERKKQ